MKRSTDDHANDPVSLHIIDTTLREGAQSPGCLFDASASVEIASQLARIGVDMIECGHPLISEAERSRIRAVRDVAIGVPILCHARAVSEDVQAVAKIGADWIGIFIGISSLSCRVRHGLTREQALERIVQTTREAVHLGLSVRFTVEDSSRTDTEDLIAAFNAAVDAGAKRICFADTVGILDPRETRRRINELLNYFPNTDVEVHLHDDRGLALANALAAAEAGAQWIATSVNGLGERCGIVDLSSLLANLDLMGERDLRHPKVLQDLSRRVATYSRAPVDARRPVVGSNAFTHTARLHRKAMERDPHSYTWIEPEKLGRSHAFAPVSEARLPGSLITKPPIISATELRYHRHGPGDRYVMIDERFVPDSRQYCIVRRIPKRSDHGPGHVDRHMHDCDSLFLFIGDNEDLTGLHVEVSLGEEKLFIDSPASVFIPAGMTHSYAVIDGGGLFVNHVLSGSYHASLLDPLETEIVEAYQ